MCPNDVTIEAGPMGPIGEQKALILRVNRNCPWNRCLFCPVYKGKRFSLRSVDEIKKDIDAIGRVRDCLEEISWEMGLNGRIKGETIRKILKHYPDIYGNYPFEMTGEQARAVESLGTIANWILHGAGRVFLQDADALITRTADLAEVIRYLKAMFPTVDTVTCYARSKTCRHKAAEELMELREAGLTWCFVGIESGNDDVLSYMKKGVTQREHIVGGRKMLESGISVAAFVMPGLGGNDGDRSRRHVRDTVSVLNEIAPTEVRVRSLAVNERSLLYRRWLSDEFSLPTDDRMIDELRCLIEGITFDCTFETLQMTNALFTLRGPFSRQKEAMLAAIDAYQHLSPLEKARCILDRYVSGGYLDCVRSWGRCDDQLEQLIEAAQTDIVAEAPGSIEAVNRAVFAIKSKGVP